LLLCVHRSETTIQPRNGNDDEAANDRDPFRRWHGCILKNPGRSSQPYTNGTVDPLPPMLISEQSYETKENQNDADNDEVARTQESSI
jgi:hypothetical protein